MVNLKKTQQEALIEALYDLALDPKNFDSFTQFWDRYLLSHQAIGDGSNDTEQLTRHFGRAFNILEKIGRESENPIVTLEECVQERDNPALALNSDGRIESINQHAVELLNACEQTTFLTDLIHRNSSESLGRGLAQVLENDTPLPIMVLLPNGQPTLLVMQRHLGSSCVIVDITGTTRDAQMEQTLKSIYKLTDKECEIAASLFQGNTINQIAECGHRNLETIRKHTKSLLRKTQTHSQPKLMRLLTSLNFAGSLGCDPRWANSQTENFTLELEDGRLLGYYDTGGKSTKVIVVLHGVLHDPELPPIMHQQLLERGYRIVGISRAWFGDSSAPLSTDNVIPRAAADLIQILNALDLAQVTLLGNMAGSVHAYATAALYPDRIRHIVNIAGMVSLTNETQINAMPKGIRAVVYTARYLPKLLPLLIRTAVAMIDTGNIKKLFETLYKSSPIDIAATKRRDIYERLTRGYQFASFHGHIAYTYEGIAVSANMSEYLDKVSCRVNLIHGAHDEITPIASVIEQCQQYPTFSLYSIEDAGQLLMYTAPKTVTNALISILQTIEIETTTELSKMQG